MPWRSGSWLVVRERLAQEAARPAGQRDPASYDELRALLYRVRPGARHDEWQRLGLEVDGVFLAEATSAPSSRCASCPRHTSRRAPATEFDAWYEDYRRLILPRTLGHSGYWTALDSHDDVWVWDCVGQVTERWPLRGTRRSWCRAPSSA